MDITIEGITSLIGISAFIGGVILAGISIYWLYYTYRIHGEIKRIYMIQSYCGSDVMEKETLRYKLKNGSLEEMFTTFQRTIFILSIIGIGVSLVGILEAYILGNKQGYTADMNVYFQFMIFIVLLTIFIVLLRIYKLNIANSSYNTKWNRVRDGLDEILTKSYTARNASEKTVFIKNKLTTFSPSFVKELIQRYRNEKYVLSNQDPSLEMVYSDQGIVDELEQLLFPQQGTVFSVNTDMFLSLLRPGKNPDPDTKEYKRDLDYIDEAYRTWLCEHASIEKADASPFPTCKKDTYVTHLPEITFSDSYSSLQSTLETYKTVGWLFFAIMLYTFYHQYYAQDRFIQTMILMVAVVLFIITMYYMMALRYDL